mgnify:CR=1 FL=1
MSTTMMPTTSMPTTRMSPITMGRVLAAERVRSRHSAASRFALVGLVLAVVQGAGWWLVSSRDMSSWRGLLGWQTMYVTALAAPLMGLLAAVATGREKRAREGGTWARPVAPGQVLGARTLVLAWQSLLVHAALCLTPMLFGMIGGLGTPPVGLFIGLWLVLWVASLLPLVIGLWLSRRAGMIVTVGVLIVWQIAGTLMAETSSWWLQPWSWMVHGAMPLLGIRANGVALPTGSPVWEWNPWIPAGLSLALAMVVTVLMVAAVRSGDRPHRRRVRSGSGRDHAVAPAAPLASGLLLERRRPSTLASVRVMLRGTAIWPLVIAAVVVLAVVALVWTPGYVAGMATWLIIPLGCCVLACLVESASAAGRRIAALRLPVAALVAAENLASLTVLALVDLAAVVARSLSGGVLGESLRLGVAWLVVGAMVLLVNACLATRFGTAAALGLTLVVLVVSLIFGGSVFAEGPLWILGVLGWPLNATTAARMALLVGVCAVVSALAWWTRVAAARRALR